MYKADITDKITITNITIKIFLALNFRRRKTKYGVELDLKRENEVWRGLPFNLFYSNLRPRCPIQNDLS